MKIVRRDNLDRETVSDILIAENVPRFYVSFLVNALNKNVQGDDLGNFFEAKSDDYNLFKREP